MRPANLTHRLSVSPTLRTIWLFVYYSPNTAESKILGVSVIESCPVLQFATNGSEEFGKDMGWEGSELSEPNVWTPTTEKEITKKLITISKILLVFV